MSKTNPVVAYEVVVFILMEKNIFKSAKTIRHWLGVPQLRRAPPPVRSLSAQTVLLLSWQGRLTKNRMLTPGEIFSRLCATASDRPQPPARVAVYMPLTPANELLSMLGNSVPFEDMYIFTWQSTADPYVAAKVLSMLHNRVTSAKGEASVPRLSWWAYGIHRYRFCRPGSSPSSAGCVGSTWDVSRFDACPPGPCGHTAWRQRLCGMVPRRHVGHFLQTSAIHSMVCPRRIRHTLPLLF